MIGYKKLEDGNIRCNRCGFVITEDMYWMHIHQMCPRCGKNIDNIEFGSRLLKMHKLIKDLVFSDKISKEEAVNIMGVLATISEFDNVLYNSEPHPIDFDSNKLYLDTSTKHLDDFKKWCIQNHVDIFK